MPPRSPEVDLDVPEVDPPRSPDGPGDPETPGPRPGDEPETPGDGPGDGTDPADGTDPGTTTPTDPLAHKPAHVSAEEYLQTRAASVHNPDADRYMLGRYNKDPNEVSYDRAAGTDHTFFSLGAAWDDIKTAQNLDNDGMFDAYNRPFIEDAVASGKPIDFSHDPRVDQNAFLFREYEMLLNPPNNYDFIDNGTSWTMVPPGSGAR